MDEFRDQLAEKFAIAYLSLQLGISEKEAKKYVLSKRPLGTLWFTLADIVTDCQGKVAEKLTK